MSADTEERKDLTASEKEALEQKRQEFLQADQKVDSYTDLVKKQFKKNKLAVFSVYVVLVLIVIAVFADFLSYEKPLYVEYKGETYLPVFKDYMVDLGISKWDPPELYNVDWKDLDDAGQLESVVWAPVPYGPNEIDLTQRLVKPGGDHYLGTDAVGRDLLAGLIHGSRISLSVGIVAAGIAVVIGVLLGSLAGYYGGKVDLIISRFIEIMLNF